MSVPDPCSKFHIDDLNIKRDNILKNKSEKNAFYLPFLWANFDAIIVSLGKEINSLSFDI